jgi:hypothetical protein
MMKAGHMLMSGVAGAGGEDGDPSAALRPNVDVALTLYRNGSWAA